MAQIENWIRREDYEDGQEKYVWKHSDFPIVAKVLKREGGVYDILVKNMVSNSAITEAEDVETLDDARDTITSWLDEHPYSDIGFTSDNLIEAWRENLEKYTNRQLGMVWGAIGDQDRENGVVVKVAKFGNMVYLADERDSDHSVGAGSLVGELYSEEGDTPDISDDDLVSADRGGRVPTAEAEVEVMAVAEGTAKDIGLDGREGSEFVVRSVEKMRDQSLDGQMMYNTGSGRTWSYRYEE